MSLMNMSIAGAVMILVVILIRALLIDKLPKRTFIILWMIVIARLLIPVEIASKTSVYNLRPELMTSPAEIMEVEEVPMAVETAEVNNIEPVAMEEPVKTLKININHIWLIGVVLLSIYFVHTYSKSKKILNTSIPCDDERIINYVKSNSDRNIDIRWLDRINTAITYGIFKPIIVLPKRLEYADDETIEKILLHEHYHIESYDSIKKLLIMVTLIVHWFNPLVWIMYIIFNRDMELYCDERVLIHLGRDERADYAYTLIEQADRDNTFSLSSGFSKNALEERVRSVMKYKKSTVITIGLAVVVLIGVVVFFATSKKDENINDRINEQSSVRVSTGYNGYKNEFELEIKNHDKVEDDKVEKSPIYYIALNSAQDLNMNFIFEDSEETSITMVDSLGKEIEVANSEEVSGEKLVKLTEGLNIFYTESKAKLGRIILNGKIDDEDSIVYIHHLNPDEQKHIEMMNFKDGHYGNEDLKYDKDKAQLYYNGKRVKKFYDIISGKEEKFSDHIERINTSIDFIDYEGEVYLYAVRDYSNKDKNGVYQFIEIKTLNGEAEYRKMIQRVQYEAGRLDRDGDELRASDITFSEGSDGKYGLYLLFGKTRKSPIYYMDTKEDQDVDVFYKLENSSGTSITLENSLGNVEEVINSQDKSGKTKIKLTKGKNTLFVESTSRVGDLSIELEASNSKEIIHFGITTTDMARAESLVGYEQEKYKDYGITLDEETARLYYNGKRVKGFYDIMFREIRENNGIEVEAVDFKDGTGEVYLFVNREHTFSGNGDMGEIIDIVEIPDEEAFQWKKYEANWKKDGVYLDKE